ncbi:Cwf19-like protein [Theobroma cacao]|nr:Cwf19-like protein [Theobroma cacao]
MYSFATGSCKAGACGLRGSIPKNFPYLHVEFGLNRGFVNVIDDERQFKSLLCGLNAIRGMLQVHEEDMYRRRRHQLVEEQKQAVASLDATGNLLTGQNNLTKHEICNPKHMGHF